MSFIKMKNKGRNGKSVGVDGKTRNRVTKKEFARVAFECNGDVAKMAEEQNLNQPKAAIKQRYENLVKMDFQLENKSLPPMIYKSERTHTTIDQKTLIKLAVEWNKSGGDSEYVADFIGCSEATVLAKIRQLDEQYEKIYKTELVKKFMEDENMTEEEAKLSAQKSIDEEGFVSPLCPRKTNSRGRKGVDIDASIISNINELLQNVEVPDFVNEEQVSIEDIISQTLDDMDLEDAD